jgi:hypothetical protein
VRGIYCAVTALTDLLGQNRTPGLPPGFGTASREGGDLATRFPGSFAGQPPFVRAACFPTTRHVPTSPRGAAHMVSPGELVEVGLVSG